jgi:cytochrome b subunit of formate dehydrogenase
MEMQKALGGLIQAVNSLTEQQKELRTKLDRISHQVYAAIVVLALLAGVVTFFAKLANDWILHRIETPQTQQQASPR